MASSSGNHLIEKLLPSSKDSFLWRVLKALELFRYTGAVPLFRYFLGRGGGVWLPVKSQPGLQLFLRRGTSDIRVFYGALARHECDFALPEEPTCIIDAGANVGVTTALFASLYPQAQILAVEPDPENVQILRKNTSSFSQVEIFESALWPRQTTVQLQNGSTAHWGRRFEENGDGASLPTITMNDLVNRSKSGRVSLLKMDIEGAEEKIFSEGDLSWISQIDCLLIEVHSEACRQAVTAQMKERSFHSSELGEKLFFSHESRPSTSPV